MQKDLGFIGLGVMGFPMAGHLTKKGYKVSVFNRTLEKSQNWTKKYNGTLCESLPELAESSEVIILCVGNDEDVRSLILGDGGILENIKENSLFHQDLQFPRCL